MTAIPEEQLIATLAEKGLALDPKYNKDILKTFELKIDYTYDLNG